MSAVAGMGDNLPSIWDVFRWAAGEEGLGRALAAWLFLIGLVIVSATFGAILTPILVAVMLLAVGAILLFGLFRLMSDAEFLGIEGETLFAFLLAGLAVAAFAAGSPVIAALLGIGVIGVIIA